MKEGGGGCAGGSGTEREWAEVTGEEGECEKVKEMLATRAGSQ